ncbi:MAG: hypothetical protein JWQ40_3670 [Segetibacter sp.]|jgi:hypothetical protein|nr:hypothetical protein [Segetibacter sp.]
MIEPGFCDFYGMVGNKDDVVLVDSRAAFILKAAFFMP